jgi:hypothetical protein
MSGIDRERKVALVASIPQPWRGVVVELEAALAAAEARAKAAEERRDNISEALAEMVEEVGFFLRNFDVGKPVHANRMRASAVHARAALTDKGGTHNDG